MFDFVLADLLCWQLLRTSQCSSKTTSGFLPSTSSGEINSSYWGGILLLNWFYQLILCFSTCSQLFQLSRHRIENHVTGSGESQTALSCFTCLTAGGTSCRGWLTPTWRAATGETTLCVPSSNWETSCGTPGKSSRRWRWRYSRKSSEIFIYLPLHFILYFSFFFLFFCWSCFALPPGDHRGAWSASRSSGTATWTRWCCTASPGTPSGGWTRRRATRRSTPASTSGESGGQRSTPTNIQAPWTCSEFPVSRQLCKVQRGERGGGANAVQGLRDQVRRHGVRTGGSVVFTPFYCLI